MPVTKEDEDDPLWPERLRTSAMDIRVDEYVNLVAQRKSINQRTSDIDIFKKKSKRLRSAHLHNDNDDGYLETSALSIERANSGQSMNTMPIEWYTFRLYSPMVGFDLEMWWRRSIFPIRLNVFIAALFFTIAIINFGAGIGLIVSHFSTTIKNPYICKTIECQKATTWMSETMDVSVKPCDNFYQFMCGKILEKPNEVPQFEELLTTPGFKIEFGEDSILAKILKMDDSGKEPIQLYQACLNSPNRMRYGLKGFNDVITYILGTNNLTTFNPSQRELEAVGTRMFHAMGSAIYFNLAFYTYPYIQHLRAMKWVPLFVVDRTDPNNTNEVLAIQLFNKLMLSFGLQPNSTPVLEMVKGVEVIVQIVKTINGKFKLNYATKNEDPPPLDPADIKTALKTLCPPMGIQFQMKNALKGFIGEDFKSDYLDPMTRKYVQALEVCFEEDPSSFTYTTFQHPKTAFVAIWVLGLFFDVFADMDRNIITDWNLDPGNYFVKGMHNALAVNVEYHCFTRMWRVLGYLPTIQYQRTMENPLEFIDTKEQQILAMFTTMKNAWNSIPQEEIDEKISFLGNALFSRGLDTNVIMPLVGGSLDHSNDPLNFTEDHLSNAFTSIKFTVEKARRNWIQSPDPVASMKWWAHGDPRYYRNRILSLQEALIQGARFLEEKDGARAGKWEKFLLRKQSSYILFPLSVFRGPHTTETLALQSGGVTFKIFHVFTAIIQEAFDENKYLSVNLSDIIGDPKQVTNQRTCSRLRYEEQATDNWTLMQIPLANFSSEPESLKDFRTVVAMKVTLKQLRDEQRRVYNLPSTWNLIPRTKKYKLQRFLPGDLSKYSEEQLHFMTIVRQGCRGGWKKYPDEIHKRYLLEARILNIFMQTEEFSQVWKCPENSFMNIGKERCLRWIPQ